MIIKCNICKREFDKPSHRNQHVKDAHKMKIPEFKPTHRVLKATKEDFTFYAGELVEKVSDNYYKDIAGNITYVDIDSIEKLAL